MSSEKSAEGIVVPVNRDEGPNLNMRVEPQSVHYRQTAEVDNDQSTSESTGRNPGGYGRGAESVSCGYKPRILPQSSIGRLVAMIVEPT